MKRSLILFAQHAVAQHAVAQYAVAQCAIAQYAIGPGGAASPASAISRPEASATVGNGGRSWRHLRREGSNYDAPTSTPQS